MCGLLVSEVSDATPKVLIRKTKVSCSEKTKAAAVLVTGPEMLWRFWEGVAQTAFFAAILFFPIVDV